MKIIVPHLLKYIPEDGMALKVTFQGKDFEKDPSDTYVIYYEGEVILDSAKLADKPKDVPMEEYKEWYAHNYPCLGVGTL